MPSPFVPPTLSPEEQEVWEKLWIALAQKSQGDLRILLHSFFSFLHRKTDFYITHHPLDVKEGVPARMGFVEGDAEKLLLASFRRFPLRRLPRMSEIHEQQQRRQQQQGKAKEHSSTDAQKQDVKKASTVDTTASSRVKHETSINHEEEVESKSSKEGPTSSSYSSPDIRFTKEGKQIPVGNGGTDFDFNFQWTQTIQEVSIALPLPVQTRARDLDVKIKHGSLSVQMKSTTSSNDEKEKKGDSSTLLEGNLKHGIRTDESTWTIEDNVLLIVLDKKEKTWWDTVFSNTEASSSNSNNQNKNIIDTALIDSTSKISEYDHATQGMIRKIIFDQRQERLGLPKSDDILRKEAVAKMKNGDDDTIPIPKQNNGSFSGENMPPLPPGVEYIDNSTKQRL